MSSKKNLLIACHRLLLLRRSFFEFSLSWFRHSQLHKTAKHGDLDSFQCRLASSATSRVKTRGWGQEEAGGRLGDWQGKTSDTIQPNKHAGQRSIQALQGMIRQKCTVKTTCENEEMDKETLSLVKLALVGGSFVWPQAGEDVCRNFLALVHTGAASCRVWKK